MLRLAGWRTADAADPTAVSHPIIVAARRVSQGNVGRHRRQPHTTDEDAREWLPMAALLQAPRRGNLHSNPQNCSALCHSCTIARLMCTWLTQFKIWSPFQPLHQRVCVLCRHTQFGHLKLWSFHKLVCPTIPHFMLRRRTIDLSQGLRICSM